MDDEVLNSIATEEGLREALGMGYPEPDEKSSILGFLKDIVSRDDNTKTGNVSQDELGEARIPVRTNLELASYCQFMGMDKFAEVFHTDAQILSSSSLSRGGFLPILAVTTKKESSTSLKNVGASTKKKGGFFGKKNDDTN